MHYLHSKGTEQNTYFKEPSLPLEYGTYLADKRFVADELRRRRLISYYCRYLTAS
jgi:hypothetical protein